ncbi:CARDB domain-containing protein [Stigmatella sp. ncwal1]|uniref:CARDB domain-containing protein n=1 Tax=Stigmatella ashevillensis TaxID=2995309 RepID=A0ABT5DDT7_9BACT|nr:CARDB domain-containing protein [Stigmatella ashevillena]MDC0711305.1 CARDB domain-containing protein [Stigmatella ashevillena]
MQRSVGKAVIGMVAWMGAVGCGTPEGSPEVPLAEALQPAVVTDGPDFIVKSVKGPASVREATGFTAEVTVCNQGTQDGSAQVGLYFSVDAVITVPANPGPYTDQPAGIAMTDYLPVGACQQLVVEGLSQVPLAGAYYLGAVADPQNEVPEIRENNNVKTGPRVGIGDEADFIVSEVSGPPSARSGNSITASIQVCNQGTQWGSTEVALYLSDDAVITVPASPSPYTDQFLGASQPVGLESGECRIVSVTGDLSGSLEEGPYYLGAVVDRFNDVTEFLEDNNAKAGNRLGFGSGPDFIVSKVSGPPSAQEGHSFVASVTVCNQGTEGGESEVGLYLSEDKVILPTLFPEPGADLPLGSREPTGWLEAGQCRALSLVGEASGVQSGAYYLGAAVDVQASSSELIEDNNTKVGNRFGIGQGPDFVVSQVSGPASVRQGSNLDVSVTVCNQGTREGSTNVDLYLSKDAVITPEGPQSGPSTDYRVGSESLSWLEPGQCQTLTVRGSAGGSSSDGAYYLGAVVDPWNNALELIEDNNTKVGSRVGVGDATDFVVTQVTSPPNVQPGQSFNAAVTVCNQGTRGGDTLVELYLSQDTIITLQNQSSEGDRRVGNGWVDYLAPGGCQTVSVEAHASVPGEGAYYLGAVANPYQHGSPELITDNNTKVSARLGVGDGTDFIVSKVTGPASAQRGGMFTASVTVCNQGTRAGSTYVEAYLSEDNTLTPQSPWGSSPDTRVASQFTGYLEPGNCQTLSLVGSASVPNSGAYFLGAVVNPHLDDELLTDNNTRVGKAVAITG